MNLNKLLTLIISILLLAVLVKLFLRLLPVILLIALGFYLFRKKPAKVEGQTYKQCVYCKKRADRKAISCDFCGRPL